MMCCRMWPGLNGSLTLSIFDELNQFLRPDLLKPLRFGIGVCEGKQMQPQLARDCCEMPSVASNGCLAGSERDSGGMALR